MKTTYKSELRKVATQNGLSNKLKTHKNNTVWQYWEKKNGREIPGYIKYCMDRTKVQTELDGLHYVLITPENLLDYLPASAIPKNYYLLDEIAHRADYVRVAALLFYGGLWVDSDCLVVDSLRPLFDDITTKRNSIVYFDILEEDVEEVEVQIGLLGAKQFSTVYYAWYKKMNQILKKSKDFDWTAIGGDLLRKIIKKDKSKKKVYDQYDTTYPLHWTEADVFFKNGSSGFLRRGFQPAVMLYNHIFPKDFKSMNDAQFKMWLKTSKSVLADLMRKTE